MSQETERASDRQIAGNHYKDMPIQTAEFCQRNKLTWCESNVVKYVTRHRHKNGVEDVKKAIHYLELLLEYEYPAISPARYAAIHTPLPAEEVAAISEGRETEKLKRAGKEIGKLCKTAWCCHFSNLFLRNCQKYNSVTIKSCQNYNTGVAEAVDASL